MSDSAKLSLLWLATGVAIFLGARYLLPFMGPFLAAALLACIIDPAVTFLARKARLGRGVASLVVLAGVIVLISAGIIIGAAQIYAEIEQLWRLLPAYDATLTQLVNQVIEDVSRFYRELPPPVLDAIRRNQNRLYLAAESLLSAFMGALGRLPALGVFIVVSVIAAYFMSRDKDVILNFLLRLVPGRLKERARTARLEVLQATVGFVRAQVILITITTVISIIGLAIIGVRYAWLLGILAGIFDFVPVVGPGTIFVPMMVYYFFIDKIWAAAVLAGIMVVTFIARRIAEPKVLSAGIGLHPLAVLISIYVGARLFGAVGFIVGPLAAVIIKAVVNAGILPLFPKE